MDKRAQEIARCSGPAQVPAPNMPVPVLAIIEACISVCVEVQKSAAAAGLNRNDFAFFKTLTLQLAAILPDVWDCASRGEFQLNHAGLVGAAGKLQRQIARSDPYCLPQHLTTESAPSCCLGAPAECLLGALNCLDKLATKSASRNRAVRLLLSRDIRAELQAGFHQLQLSLNTLHIALSNARGVGDPCSCFLAASLAAAWCASTSKKAAPCPLPPMAVAARSGVVQDLSSASPRAQHPPHSVYCTLSNACSHAQLYSQAYNALLTNACHLPLSAGTGSS